MWLAKEIHGDIELRTVALKLFAVGTGSGAQSRERIVQEARALCQVEHPNVVRFCAITSDPGGTIVGLVMEYVHGTALDRRLEDTRTLSIEETLTLGVSVASALSSVHQVGLVHRDIKPANVVESAGVYKLIDFGIAGDTPRAHAAQRERAKVVLDDLPLDVAGSKLSSLGLTDTEGVAVDESGYAMMVTGTLGYIDPRCIATGSPATPASDLYSLGALLFECMVGRVPAVAAAVTAGGRGFRGDWTGAPRLQRSRRSSRLRRARAHDDRVG